ncbi:MAG TPA: carbohydrate ABC transporter permease [Clostridia bacterium]|nr:carbohydrate ABC transporter permease [Clostridia bacterium]
MGSYAKRKTLNLVFVYILAILLSIIFVIPLIFTFSNSLRDLYSSPVLIPKTLNWSNYNLAVTLIPFWKYVGNSGIITGISVSLAICMNFLFGYAFARLKAPGKNAMFILVLSMLMVPGIAVQIPQFIIFSNIGIKDTYWIWILGGLGGNAFYIFLFRQFLSSLPKDLEDAARIDGCTTFTIIWRIFVPLSWPAIAVVAMLDFNGAWGDYMTGYMFLSPKNYPLSTALISTSYSLPNQPTIQLEPVVNAAALLLTLPVIVVFFLGQRYLVEGIVTTGIKG